VHPPRIILIMGVAGSGKTTIGRRLAADLGWPYYEADDFHSAANKDKMARGTPLDDYDRAPWLASIRAAIDDCAAEGKCAVFTCSGLKEKYRRVLMDDAPHVALVYLHTDFETSLARVSRRQGHYMKAEMVKSQFDALEMPTGCVTMDTKLPPDKIVTEIKRTLAL
jgi:gluconokinase